MAEKTVSAEEKTTEMILAEYRKEFTQLPEEHMRGYEKQIVVLSQKYEQDVVQEAMEHLLGNKTETDPVRYAAYCTLHTLHRRLRDKEKLRVLRFQHEKEFQEHPSALHFQLLSYVDLGEEIEGESVLIQAVESAGRMRGSAGAEHLTADLVVRFYKSNPHLRDTPRGREWMSTGLQAVERAIANDSYAKFHYTKARLLSMSGQYDRALHELQIAQDLEDSSRRDYALRMATYLTEANRIEGLQRSAEMEEELMRHTANLDAKQQTAERNIAEQMGKLDDSSVKNLEFLGLFAGIISFTIGGISIVASASQFSFTGAAGLLVVLMGTLLEVFCGFGVILHGLGKTPENRQRNLVVCIFGVVMIALGLALCASAGMTAKGA